MAMPAARRCIALASLAVLFERFNILLEDVVEGEDQSESGDRIITSSVPYSHGHVSRSHTATMSEPRPRTQHWAPNPDPTSIVIPGVDATASVNDQIDQIDQLITIRLQVRASLFLPVSLCSIQFRTLTPIFRVSNISYRPNSCQLSSATRKAQNPCGKPQRYVDTTRTHTRLMLCISFGSLFMRLRPKFAFQSVLRHHIKQRVTIPETKVQSMSRRKKPIRRRQKTARKKIPLFVALPYHLPLSLAIPQLSISQETSTMMIPGQPP